jgi:hypothetical protein
MEGFATPTLVRTLLPSVYLFQTFLPPLSPCCCCLPPSLSSVQTFLLMPPPPPLLLPFPAQVCTRSARTRPSAWPLS